MAGCCGRDGGSRWVGVTVWVLTGLVLLGVWIARQGGPADPEQPSRPAGPMTVAPSVTPSGGE